MRKLEPHDRIVPDIGLSSSQNCSRTGWADFVHKTNELVILAEGEIEIEIEGKSQQPPIGREVFIPANAMHTVRNVGNKNNVWFYGYKR